MCHSDSMKSVQTKKLYLAMILGATVAATPSFATDAPIVLRGWLEHALLPEVDLQMDAKLDTGAKTSSIGAEILSSDDDSAR